MEWCCAKNKQYLDLELVFTFVTFVSTALAEAGGGGISAMVSRKR